MNTNKLYLVLDTELTGLDEQCNLITLYMAIISSDGEILSELDLKLEPNDGLFTVDPESMKINDIDLRGWKGVKYKDARKIVDDFIREYGTSENRLIPLGQGVAGDIKRIQSCLISKERWDEVVERVPIDTLYLAQFLKLNQRLNIDSISLENLVKFFDIKIFRLHNAREDALVTFEVYNCLIKQLKGISNFK